MSKRDLDWKIYDYFFPNGQYSRVPYFTTTEADALLLLPLLKERGFSGRFLFGPNGYDFAIVGDIPEYGRWGRKLVANRTITEAITKAVLELIEINASVVQKDGRQ